MKTSTPLDAMTTSELQPIEELVCFALYSSGLAMTKVYRRLLSPLRLTYPQYLVMRVLWEKDGKSVSELGERLHLDSATLTPLLKRLEKVGLITRRRSRGDERHVVIALTSDGTSMREKALSIQEAIAAATHCSYEELASLKDRLQLLRRDLSRSI